MVEEDVLENVAANARLNLSDDEQQQFKEDLEDILEAFESLDEIETDDVEPAFHPIDVSDRKREDQEEDCLDQDEALENTTNSEDSYFKGPRAT